MCGISILYNYPKEETLEGSNYILKHRGPDESILWEDKNIKFGMTRLAIQDLRQGLYPLTNEKEDIILIYNGEIYNNPELRKYLEKLGHKFKTNSDGEVIVHLYEEEGLDCLSRFEGQFVIVLYDRKKNRLILARDKFGIKPLFYHIDGVKLAAASELKALLPHIENPQIDQKSKRDFFSLLYIPSPNTIIKGIKKLEPGAVLICDNNRFIYKKHFNYSVRTPKKIGKPNEKLHELLTDAVKKRLVSDVPIGAFLSGGLDSSLIASIASQFKPHLKTFSVNYPGHPLSEGKYAKEVSDMIGSRHHQIDVNFKNINQKLIRKLVYQMDEPFADESFIPTYLVSEHTKKYVTVCLSGDGADELFMGYNHINFIAKNRIKLPFLCKIPVINEFTRKVRKYGYMSKMSVAEQYRVFSSYDNQQGRLRFMGSVKTVNDLPTADVNNFLSEDGLTKVDRMSMANSLEVRTPFLDSSLAYISSIMNYKQKLEKKCLKDMAAHYKLIPKSVINRKKQGFLMPSEVYMPAVEEYVPKNLNISNFSKHKQTHIRFAHAIYEIWKQEYKIGI